MNLGKVSNEISEKFDSRSSFDSSNERKTLVPYVGDHEMVSLHFSGNIVRNGIRKIDCQKYQRLATRVRLDLMENKDLPKVPPG